MEDARPQDMVSVPSRGILFPNTIPKGHCRIKEETYQFPSPLGVSYFQMLDNGKYSANGYVVSVPSRGILFPNIYLMVLRLRRISLFPSPLGVSYFQIERRKQQSSQRICFRPLSGYLISKFIYALRLKNSVSGFPSPLGVSYFQI